MKKIFIAGSMHFAKEMLKAQKTLKKLGYRVVIPSDTLACLENPELNMDDNHCFSKDIMRNSMKKQKQCDAILVLNYPKNKIDGYIGGAVLIELGLAYFLNQKIFLLYPPPSIKDLRYSQEILHMKPIILCGNLSKIADYLSS